MFNHHVCVSIKSVAIGHFSLWYYSIDLKITKVFLKIFLVGLVILVSHLRIYILTHHELAITEIESLAYKKAVKLNVNGLLLFKNIWTELCHHSIQLQNTCLLKLSNYDEIWFKTLTFNISCIWQMLVQWNVGLQTDFLFNTQ